MLKLYHNDMSVCAQKVRMVLAEKGIEWEGIHLNLRAGDQFKPEFRRLNPKAVVPVIDHDGAVITESNAIIEYLDEVFPRPALMPAAAADRARVRKWLIQLDAELHVAVATLSFAIAFRHQVIEKQNTPAALEAFYSSIPDPGRRMHMRDLVSNGLDARSMESAVYAYERLLAAMETALAGHDWIVGDSLSLADFAYAPYITRLAQLQLQRWWEARPNLERWFERVCATPGYQAGLAAWINPHYIELMRNTGNVAWPRIAALIDAARQSR